MKREYQTVRVGAYQSGHYFDQQINEQAKKGWRFIPPLTIIEHPEVLKELQGGGTQTTFAWTEIIAMMTRTIEEPKKEIVSAKINPPEGWFDPNLMGNASGDFKGEF